MNYLAHAYLSFNDPGLVTGNLISDFVKGKAKYDYPPGVLRGIDLHRAIDTFTDSHATTKEAREIFRPHYRLYAGAFMDVVYDHFLATDARRFPGNELLAFTEKVYEQLAPFVSGTPERFQQLFPYMRTQNWLFNYQYRAGIEKSFRGLVHRAVYMDDHQPALALFDQHYAYLQSSYEAFFPDLYAFARARVPGNA